MSFDAAAALRRIEQQLSVGPRFVGSEGHRRAQDLLASWLREADVLTVQSFEDTFFGERVECQNIWGHFEGTGPQRILLGSHYDTRPWADEDPDPARHRDPVPGANDGGSGVALLAELVPMLLADRDRPSIDIVFFDAEDWHQVDGKTLSMGAAHFVDSLTEGTAIDAVVVPDMIARTDLMLDVDVTCEEHPPSFQWNLELFQLGQHLGLPAFGMKKKHPYKWVTDDHIPFMKAGIPSALLIDMDFPEWHTVADTIDVCSEDSLAQMGRFFEALVFPDRR